MKVKKFFTLVVTLSLLTAVSIVAPNVPSNSVKATVQEDFQPIVGFFTENKGQWDRDILFVSDAKTHLVITQSQLKGNSVVGMNELPFYYNFFFGNNPELWATHCRNFSKLAIKDFRGNVVENLYPRGESQVFPLSMQSQNSVIYSTFLGGIKDDFATDVTIDDKDCAYVLGYTQSIDFPVRSPLQTKNNGGFDVFISKLDPGGQLLFSSYLGGSKDDFGAKITFDLKGNIYFTGKTNSTNFPVKNAYQPKNAGGLDAFVTKLNAQGTAIIFSTYFGGSGSDWAKDLDVDEKDYTYFTGGTDSTNFPVRYGVQTKNNGGQDAFVVKLCEHGQHLWNSSYLGGSKDDSANAILEYNGLTYISGYTKSTNFPTVKPYQSRNNGNTDAFLATINLGEYKLTYASYLGGANNDEARDCTLDKNLNILVTGYTYSTNFPVKNAFQTKLKGVDDAFITKLNSSGSAVLFSTYLGGSSGDWCNDIDTDDVNNYYVTGGTLSGDFPVKNAFQATNKGKTDVFFSTINSSGSSLLFSSYYGGSEDEWSNNIDLGDQGGIVYITGGTKSTNFPVKNAAQKLYKGGQEAFVFKYEMSVTPSP